MKNLKTNTIIITATGGLFVVLLAAAFVAYGLYAAVGSVVSLLR